MSSSSGAAPISRRREVTKEIATGFGLATPNVIRDVLKALKLPPIGTKNSMIQAIEDTVMKHGIQLFLAKFKKQTLKQIGLMLEVEPKIRTILDIIMTHGLPAFLQQKCDVKLLQECCRMLGLDPGSALDSSSTVAKTSEELEREIADEVMLMGTDEMLRSLPLNVLTELARDLGILPPITDINAIPTFPNGREVTVLALTESIMDKIFDLVSVQHYLAIAQPPRTHQNSTESGSPTNAGVIDPPPAKRPKLSHNDGSNDAPDNMEDANGAASSSAAAFIASQNAVRRSKTTKSKGAKGAKARAQASSPTKIAPDAEESVKLDSVPEISHGGKKPKGSKTVREIRISAITKTTCRLSMYPVFRLLHQHRQRKTKWKWMMLWMLYQ